MIHIEEREDGAIVLSGYVNAVERDSRILPKGMAKEAKRAFVERIRAGTFKKALEKNRDVRLKLDHEREIGGQKEGNLQLEEDAIGLKIRAETMDEEVKAAAKEGKLTGWSFGFSATGQTWEAGTAYDRRTVTEIELYEVSILRKTPAYIGTTVEIRSYEKELLPAETAKKYCDAIKTKGRYYGKN